MSATMQEGWYVVRRPRTTIKAAYGMLLVTQDGAQHTSVVLCVACSKTCRWILGLWQSRATTSWTVDVGDGQHVPYHLRA